MADSGHSSASGLNDYNWLPQDNFQFDPSLFGAYRESQENILSNVLDDSFFNDALDADFTQPYNLPTTAAAPKNNLIAGIDSAEDTKTSVPPGEDLACHRLWQVFQVRPVCLPSANEMTGRSSKVSRRFKVAISTWTVSARTCKRRLSAPAMVSSSTSRTSKRYCRNSSALARRTGVTSARCLLGPPMPRSNEERHDASFAHSGLCLGLLSRGRHGFERGRTVVSYGVRGTFRAFDLARSSSLGPGVWHSAKGTVW